MTIAPRQLVALLAGILVFAPALAGSNGKETMVPSFSTLLRRPLSLQEALNIAAAQNSLILAAKQEVEARYGIAIQVKAIVLPKVVAEAGYLYRQDSLIEQNQSRELSEFDVSLPGLGIERTIGGGNIARINNQAWSTDVRIVQSLYEGGRLMSALRQDTLIREQAMLDFQTVVADVLLQTRVAYDTAQLATLQMKLREQSVTLLGGILDKIKEQRKVGAVTEFEELRAKVEQDNARTPLALARQDFIIAKQRLVQILGYDVPANSPNNVGLNLSTPLRAPKYERGLAAALTTAESQRTELASIRVASRLGDEAVIVAKAGTKPSVQAFAGYEVTSRAQSRNIGDPYAGALTGVQVSWPIFDGFFTRGRVAEAVARRAQIGHNTDELARQIHLQVRSAWARMTESRNILNLQATNVEGAVRAEELATTRYNTGTGSQVEVLSAQTALTDARDFYATALHNYSVAYSQLLRATGEDMQRTRGKK
jgi:outer membrane protein TolC